MSLSTGEIRAIGWYAKAHDLRPQLMVRPVARFLARDDEIVEENVANIVGQYQRAKKDEAAERARKNKAEGKNNR